METTLERTPTQKQLHAMRVELGQMLDECREMCEFVGTTNAALNHCKACRHGEEMREQMAKIMELQTRDRRERNVVKEVEWVKDRDRAEQKPVQAGEDSKIDKSDWFSPRFKTFEDWLASQPKPHSTYVRRMVYLHGQNPGAKLAELHFTRTTPREKAAAKRAAPATRAKVIRGMTFEEALMWYEDHGVHVPKNMQPGGRLYQRWMRLREDYPNITVGEVMDYKKSYPHQGKNEPLKERGKGTMAKSKKPVKQTSGVTRIKAACGHMVSYPAAWNMAANEMNRAFITVCGCECGNGHAIVVQKSGIDVVTSDNPLRLVATLDKIPVHEEVWVDENGILPFKSTASKKIIHQFMSRLSKIGPPLTGKEKRTREFTQQFFNDIGL